MIAAVALQLVNLDFHNISITHREALVKKRLTAEGTRK